MIILLDTCDFLWHTSGDPRLPEKTRLAVEDPANTIFLSVISFWEIVVKHRLGKLPLPQTAETYIPRLRERNGIFLLELTEAAVARLAALPDIHRDPFDRMLVAQAQAHSMWLATSDPVLIRYPVQIL